MALTIERVDSIVAGDAHFVRITADDGTTGIGQSGCWAFPAAVDAIVTVFRNHLVGEDAFRIERIWHHLYRMGAFRGSVLMAAVSAVDIALWDLKGRALGVPVWEMLGGRYRDRIRLHLPVTRETAEDSAAAARQGVADGFTAVKVYAFPPSGHHDMPHARVVEVVRDRVAAVREAVGTDADVIVEVGRQLSPLTSAAVLEALRGFDLLFVEDLIQIDSISAQADLASVAPVPLGFGERMHSVWEFRELLERGGAQYVRADVGLCGGISHAKKIAAVAESFVAHVNWHNWLGPVLTAASAHLDAAIPNMVTQEYKPASDEGPLAQGFRSDWRRDGGWLVVPDTPGLGVELDESRLEPVELLGRDVWDIPARGDGSVAYAG